VTAFILTLVEILIRVLVPALLSGTASRAPEDGARQPELRERLQKAVRAQWAAALLLLLLCPVGCAARTVYIPSGEPVRLRETIRNAKVWVLDKTGTPVPGVMDLPESWYVLPDPGPENQ